MIFALGHQGFSAEILSGLKVRLSDSYGYETWTAEKFLPVGARAFSGSKGVKIKISESVHVELGRESVLSVKAIDDGKPSLWLTRGRMRVLSEQQALTVKTPSCDIDLTHGKSDIIIANLNTLCIGREGDGLKVRSKLDEQKVPIQKYVLATPQGALIIKEIEKGNELSEEDDDVQGDS